MTWAGHAAVGAMSQSHPVVTFIWGFFSHWVLDESFEEPKFNLFSVSSWKKNWKYVARQVVLIGLVYYFTHNWWGMLSGVFPDIFTGLRCLWGKYVRGVDYYATGDHLLPFHRSKGRKKRPKVDAKWVIVGTELAFVLVAIFSYLN